MILESVRINRFLARSGLGSRRNVEKFITNGEVSVNGLVVRDLFYRVSDTDHVEYMGQSVQLPKSYRYIALNKPEDVVVSRKSNLFEKGVFELFKEDADGLLYAGRLDKMSRGLILFSDDGNFIQQMSHPSFKTPRLYHLKLKAFLSVDIKSVCRSFLEGIQDDSELLKAEFVDLKPQGSNIFSMDVILQSGKKRQLRRMCDQVGFEVVDLFRYGIGKLRIDTMNLESGQWRLLTPAELTLLDFSVDPK